MLNVGKITKSQGIKGEVKILPFTDEKIFQKIKTFFVDEKPVAVENLAVRPNGIFVKFEGIDSVRAAETFKNKLLFVPKIEAQNALEKGEFFLEDALNAAVFLKNKKLGEIEDIDNFGSTDVFFVTAEKGKNFSFPAVENIFEKIDFDKKQFFVSPSVFKEVVVYED